MTKQELAAKVADKTGLSRTQATEAIEATMETIIQAVSRERGVYLRGFGTFTAKHRAEKKARNISRGETITIPATRKPVFKPSKVFTGRVGGK
jgi:DNA-binding protein HU-beta